ncbi:hypothetical protein QFC19_006299 [Naganishia cerealis]|uniref:Uncharacterized protein n=1 Tax=Naganishia cerealis TaxID=610337 RepID=A0ACC2VIU6_9TREE|nr:hypothetical protein QFC19_006299 [Naganishia cerealis]
MQDTPLCVASLSSEVPVLDLDDPSHPDTSFKPVLGAPPEWDIPRSPGFLAWHQEALGKGVSTVWRTSEPTSL